MDQTYNPAASIPSMKTTRKKSVNHFAKASTASRASLFSWSSEVSRYQWLVLAVAWLGWVFDSMDGTLFSLVQKPSMTELMGPGATDASIGFYSSVGFSVLLVG